LKASRKENAAWNELVEAHAEVRRLEIMSARRDSGQGSGHRLLQLTSAE